MAGFSRRTTRLLPIAMLAATALSGCAQNLPKDSPVIRPPPTPQRVDFENLAARTTAADSSPTVTTDDFLGQIVALLQKENSDARIYRLVKRFPDASLDMLRETTAAQASQPAWRALAIAYDKNFLAIGTVGWTATLADAAAHPAEYDLVHRARQQAMQYIEMGRPELVFEDSSIKNADASSFVGAELNRLRGIAWLLRDKPEDALACWQNSAPLVAPDKNVAAEFALLRAEGLRRAGKAADEIAPWTTAAIDAVIVHDPALWQRILESRPDGTDWPRAVAIAFDAAVNDGSTTQPAELGDPIDNTRIDACIWRNIGEWRLSRHEIPSGLLAFKQSEFLFATARDKGESRIAQARALLLMNQSGAATSILTTLAVDPDPVLSHHALAVLGNARLAANDVAGALGLLRKAVADEGSLPIAILAPARADLGLVLLMSDQEQEGLNWLHRAQDDFAKENDIADLCQSLQNEAAYLTQIGRDDEAAAISERASRLAALP
jgi:tetratricopeptide (TPR) repeat protein